MPIIPIHLMLQRFLYPATAASLIIGIVVAFISGWLIGLLLFVLSLAVSMALFAAAAISVHKDHKQEQREQARFALSPGDQVWHQRDNGDRDQGEILAVALPRITLKTGDGAVREVDFKSVVAA